MNNRNSNLVIAAVLALLMAGIPVLASASVRIMNVGDYDVSGYRGYASYRYDLWFLLADDGYDVDFVGRFITHESVVNEELYPRFGDFDDNHEGRNGNSLGNVESTAANLVEINEPHIVVIMIAQDLCDIGSGAVSLATLQLGSAIDNMRAVNPQLHFVLGHTYPWEYPDCRSDLIPDYNQAISGVAQAKDLPGSRVLVADNHTGFNVGTMLDDDTVANRAGEMFMAGKFFAALETIIPLVDDTEEITTPINAGMNDAWYNPNTLGQGFFITVFPDIEMMFLAWFTYDTERPAGSVEANLGEPGHRWLTAFGPYTGNKATLQVEVTSGGVFDSANPSVSQQPDGTITVEFAGCNEAMVFYDIDSANVAGEVPIERIALDNIAVCEALAQ